VNSAHLNVFDSDDPKDVALVRVRALFTPAVNMRADLGDEELINSERQQTR
jgi:hypothetical protein